ncbi:unnamed protein product [Eretmochelys imbricata]
MSPRCFPTPRGASSSTPVFWAQPPTSQAGTTGRWMLATRATWVLGVCYESVRCKAKIDAKPDTGYWRVRLWNGKYVATTTPFTLLCLRVKPKRVGVFLDYEAGKVSFYNVTDHSHIYSFSVEFAEPICPLFYPEIRVGHAAPPCNLPALGLGLSCVLSSCWPGSDCHQ